MTESPTARFALLGAVVVVAFDVTGALLSQPLDFDYQDLFWVQLAIYATGGYLAARQTGARRDAARTGALIAAADASVGWALSYVLVPDAYGYTDKPSLALILAVFVGVVLLGAILGFLGGVLARRFRPAT